MAEAVIEKKKFSTLELVYIAIFAAMMAVCSWVAIPAPPPFAPFTMQTFGVFIALLMLGGRRGFFAILTFILMALVGLPVLEGFSGGAGVVFGKTGGYIMGFLLMALIYWGMVNALGDKLLIKYIALILGLIVCYAFGTAWFMVVYTRETGPVGLWSALTWCVAPYILPDTAKLILACGISNALKKRISI